MWWNAMDVNDKNDNCLNDQKTVDYIVNTKERVTSTNKKSNTKSPVTIVKVVNYQQSLLSNQFSKSQKIESHRSHKVMQVNVIIKNNNQKTEKIQNKPNQKNSK